MNTRKLLFAQSTTHLPLTRFRRCVSRHKGDHKVKRFTWLEQFLVKIFAQPTFRESLLDVQVCLRAPAGQALSHGIALSWYTQHAGQRSARLPRLRRISTAAQCDSAQALHERAARGRTVEYRLRARLDDCRSVLVAASVGIVPLNHGSGKASHSARHAREYPDFSAHQRRQAPLHQHSRSAHSRSWRLL